MMASRTTILSSSLLPQRACDSERFCFMTTRSPFSKPATDGCSYRALWKRNFGAQNFYKVINFQGPRGRLTCEAGASEPGEEIGYELDEG